MIENRADPSTQQSYGLQKDRYKHKKATIPSTNTKHSKDKLKKTQCCTNAENINKSERMLNAAHVRTTVAQHFKCLMATGGKDF